MNLDLAGKCVLVAGASRGIGLAIAEVFLEEGATVILTGRTEDRLRAALAGLAVRHGDRASTIRADMSDINDIETVVRETVPLDIAVVNYGATDTAPGFDTPPPEWDRLITANLTGPVRLARAVALGMRNRRDGVVLFVGSIAGLESIGAPIAYGVGKCGLRAAMKAMARELGADGVRVNLISPGNVLFEGGRWAEKRAADPKRIEGIIEDKVPMRRFGAPREIAEVAAFVCSERAGFMTGADVVVDGGQTTAF